jgi:cytochrome P450
VTTAIVPCVSGGQEEHGHLEEFRTDPIALMHRVREECGDFGIFHLAHKKVVLLSGAQASEFFFGASDEDLDQAEAYPFMTPIFGEGVGAASATMQIKVIFSVLLRECEFEMAQPADTYRNDHSKVVVQLERPAVEGALPQAGKAMS